MYISYHINIVYVNLEKINIKTIMVNFEIDGKKENIRDFKLFRTISTGTDTKFQNSP